MIGIKHAGFSRAEIRAAHPDAKYGGCLYVVAFDNGTVKVGRTNRPANRLNSHMKDGVAFGANVTQTWVSEVHWNISATEARLIKAMAEMTTDRRKSEYFGGVAFEQAVAAATAIEAERITEETIAAHEQDLIERHELNRQFLSRLFPAGGRPDVFALIKETFGESLVDGEIDFMPIPDGERVSQDTIEGLAEARGEPVAAVLSMNYIDMLKFLLQTSVTTAALKLEAWARESSRDDLLLTYAEMLGEDTPKDASTSTPLDSLKDVFWEVKNTLDYVADHLTSN